MADTPDHKPDKHVQDFTSDDTFGGLSFESDLKLCKDMDVVEENYEVKSGNETEDIVNGDKVVKPSIQEGQPEDPIKVSEVVGEAEVKLPVAKNSKRERKIIKSPHSFDIAQGVTEYVGTCKGFTAFAKNKFCDLIVHEIDENGEKVELKTSVVPSNRPKDKKTGLIRPEGVQPNDWEKLLHVNDSPGACETVKIKVNKMAKEEREAIKNAVTSQLTNVEFCGRIFKWGSLYIVARRKPLQLSHIPGKGFNWPKDRPEYTHFVLFKSTRETLDVISHLAGSLKRPIADFGITGATYVRGTTTQRVSVKRVPPYFISALVGSYGRSIAGNFSFKDCGLRMGQMQGNHFQIVLRTLLSSDEDVKETMESLKEKGFVNYIDAKKFLLLNKIEGIGVKASLAIGLAVLKKNWKEAVKLMLTTSPTGNESKEMSQMRQIYRETGHVRKAYLALQSGQKEDTMEGQMLDVLTTLGTEACETAIEKCSSGVKRVHMGVYHSYVWNKLVSRRIQKFGLAPMVGDLYFPDGVTFVENEVDLWISSPSGEVSDSNKATMAVPSLVTEDNLPSVSMDQVVMPVPGSDVIYPENEVGQWYKELMQKKDYENVDLTWMSSETNDFRGGYRPIVRRPKDLEWRIVKYDNSSCHLLQSDEDILKKKPLFIGNDKGAIRGVALEFSLPYACDPSMLLREVTRASSSSFLVLGVTPVNSTHLPSLLSNKASRKGKKSDYKLLKAYNKKIGQIANTTNLKAKSSQDNTPKDSNLNVDTIKLPFLKGKVSPRLMKGKLSPRQKAEVRRFVNPKSTSHPMLGLSKRAMKRLKRKEKREKRALLKSSGPSIASSSGGQTLPFAFTRGGSQCPAKGRGGRYATGKGKAVGNPVATGMNFSDSPMRGRGMMNPSFRQDIVVPYFEDDNFLPPRSIVRSTSDSNAFFGGNMSTIRDVGNLSSGPNYISSFREGSMQFSDDVITSRFRGANNISSPMGNKIPLLGGDAISFFVGSDDGMLSHPLSGGGNSMLSDVGNRMLPVSSGNAGGPRSKDSSQFLTSENPTYGGTGGASRYGMYDNNIVSHRSVHGEYNPRETDRIYGDSLLGPGPSTPQETGRTRRSSLLGRGPSNPRDAGITYGDGLLGPGPKYTDNANPQYRQTMHVSQDFHAGDVPRESEIVSGQDSFRRTANYNDNSIRKNQQMSSSNALLNIPMSSYNVWSKQQDSQIDKSFGLNRSVGSTYTAQPPGIQTRFGSNVGKSVSGSVSLNDKLYALSSGGDLSNQRNPQMARRNESFGSSRNLGGNYALKPPEVSSRFGSNIGSSVSLSDRLYDLSGNGDSSNQRNLEIARRNESFVPSRNLSGNYAPQPPEISSRFGSGLGSQVGNQRLQGKRDIPFQQSPSTSKKYRFGY